MAFDLFNPTSWSKEKTTTRADPLDSIRARLEEIASGVTGAKERREESIRKTFGQARQESYGDLAERLHATKGFGETSLEPYGQSLISGKLGAQEESALTANEVAMMNLEAGLLGKAGALETGDIGDYEDLLSESDELYPSDTSDTGIIPTILRKILRGEQVESTDWLDALKKSVGTILMTAGGAPVVY